MQNLILKFDQIRISDVNAVGGKNASLGEMYSRLTPKGIVVPNGFATTSQAFDDFLTLNKLHQPLQQLVDALDRKNYANLRETGAAARALILSGQLPKKLQDDIREAYRELGKGSAVGVAVRSSATAEDLPQASFAGQHDSFLNISSEEQLLEAVLKCFASLYTDRAIKYREDNGFEHSKVLLSVGVQLMVRADTACSGVAFTLEPESGFRDIIHISGAWGLGENIVQGTVTPDEYFVFKPILKAGKDPIVNKKLGEKEMTMIYGADQNSVTNTETPPEKRRRFVLSDAEIRKLAGWCLTIEEHYGRPMDIEWAKDGNTGQIQIIQARPETVHAGSDPLHLLEYAIESKGTLLTSGEAIGARLSVGRARILHSPADTEKLEPGDIVVTELTSPDWDPILKNAGAIVTDKGGRTSHASIVARELGVPAIVGCGDATKRISDGQLITVSCCEGNRGFVYEGAAKYRETSVDLSSIEMPRHTRVMLIVGDPDKAYRLSFYPNDGVGLMRLEFIITHSVLIHPMALHRFEELQDPIAKARIAELTAGYADKEHYFVDRLAQGVATIAAAFYPKPVIVRMSDFKTNEYANLLGGKEFEPEEENPMIGFRGASRYYHPLYREGFRLECEAVRKVRNEMGLVNVKVMIPFCRTLSEGRKVLEMMSRFGLAQGDNGLEVYVMAEIPSNVLLAGKFAELFDGFSIGSNDLTQLTLGIDRDSAIISPLFSEKNEAAEEMVSEMIRKAKLAGVPIGLCGQAPSDFPDYAQFLVDRGIDSISFNPDALLTGIANIRIAEQQVQPAESTR